MSRANRGRNDYGGVAGLAVVRDFSVRRRGNRGQSNVCI
jgi:hypothetical protein